MRSDDGKIYVVKFQNNPQHVRVLANEMAPAAALQEAVTKDASSIEKKLQSHSAAIDSVRAALSQNEELVEGIVETLQMLNGVRDDLAEDPLAAAS